MITITLKHAQVHIYNTLERNTSYVNMSGKFVHQTQHAHTSMSSTSLLLNPGKLVSRNLTFRTSLAAAAPIQLYCSQKSILIVLVVLSLKHCLRYASKFPKHNCFDSCDTSATDLITLFVCDVHLSINSNCRMRQTLATLCDPMRQGSKSPCVILDRLRKFLVILRHVTDRRSMLSFGDHRHAP